MDLPNFKLQDLIEAGVHFGHKSQRWNPKMSKYIHSTRENVHIIDLGLTIGMLTNALKVIQETVSKGGKILFVATKKQASARISDLAIETDQYYVNHRWLGGMLTNWSTINKSIKKMKELEGLKSNPKNEFTKKEILKISNQHEKLLRSLNGISEMKKSPDLLFIIDTRLEHIAVAEAKNLNISIIGIVDTNCDPDLIDYPIPGNDDSRRSIDLYCELISETIKNASSKIDTENFSSESKEKINTENEPVASKEEIVKNSYSEDTVSSNSNSEKSK